MLRDSMRVEALTDSTIAHIEDLVYRRNEDNIQAWAWRNHYGRVYLKIEDEDGVIHDFSVSRELSDESITLMTMDYEAEKLLIASDNHEIFWFDLTDPANIYLKDSWKASQSRITAMDFLIGSNTLIVGNEAGQVFMMFPVRTLGNRQKFTRIREFGSHANPVSSIRVSPRNRTFLTIDTEGKIRLRYSTTGATESRFEFSSHRITDAEFAPKADGILLIDDQNNIGLYSLENEHPEVSLESIFGKVWYEGYSEPE